MSKVIITADSTCDLGPELTERYQIKICPLHIVEGEESFLDGVDIDPDKLYQIHDEKGILPKTAAINVQEYIDFFTPLLDGDTEIIHINLGSGFSSCYQNAMLAADELDGVHPIDSMNLSTGQGLLVLTAADLAAEGKNAAAIEEELLEVRDKVRCSFILSTLEYMYKGGRCSALALLGSNLLAIRPTIDLDPTESKMGVGKKYRGTFEKTVKMYVHDKLADRDDIRPRRIFLTHSGISAEMAELVKAEIAQCQNFDEVLETRAGCTVSSHCGPNCLGVLFIEK